MSSMEDRSPQVLAVNVLFFILSWLAVGLRVFVRAGMRKIFGLDDWLMVATQMVYSAYLACQLDAIRYGIGRHLSDLTTENAVHALHLWWFCEVFYVISACLLKLSVAVFLFRITARPVHVWILRILMAGTVVFGFFYLLLAFLQCKPISQWWTIDRKGCISGQIVVNATYCASTVNAIADWIFGLLPIFIVRDLQMSKRTKIMVAGILGFAALGSTATVVRIPYISTLGDTQDFLWVTTNFAIWTTLEVGIGIVAACAPTLRPLLQAIIGTSSQETSSHQPPLRRRRRPILGAFWKPFKAGNPERGKYQRQFTPDIIPLYNPPNNAKTSVVESRETKPSDEESGSHGPSNVAIVRTVSISVAEVRAARLQPRNHTRDVAPWPAR